MFKISGIICIVVSNLIKGMKKHTIKIMYLVNVRIFEIYISLSQLIC